MSKAYQLTDEQVLACARLCQQEQGTAKGAAAEMSLALNLYEKNQSRYSSVYDYMRNSGWFANAAYFMDNGRCNGDTLTAVISVLTGNRTLPEYVDEHDCFADILSISTGNKYVKSDYIPDVTAIKNTYGAEYTFYCFPDDNSDPFGYTSKPTTISDPVESAVAWMIALAEDDSHGYDQKYRWGEKGDYDCSSAVISAYKHAGIDLSCTYTGDMRKDMISKGFADVTAQVNLVTGEGLRRGDVLLNERRHTALYIGEGMEAEALVNEQGQAIGGKPGDQTGNEITLRAYRDFPWDCILRYQGEASTKEAVKTQNAKLTVAYVQKGCTGAWVTMLQTALNLVGGYGLEVDGEFGKNTDRALRGYQDSIGVAANGKAGPKTWAALNKEMAARTYTT